MNIWAQCACWHSRTRRVCLCEERSAISREIETDKYVCRCRCRSIRNACKLILLWLRLHLKSFRNPYIRKRKCIQVENDKFSVFQREMRGETNIVCLLKWRFGKNRRQTNAKSSSKKTYTQTCLNESINIALWMLFSFQVAFFCFFCWCEKVSLPILLTQHLQFSPWLRLFLSIFNPYISKPKQRL